MPDLEALKVRFSGKGFPPAQGEGLDLERYLSHYNIPVKVIKPNGTSTLHVLETCLFDPMRIPTQSGH